MRTTPPVFWTQLCDVEAGPPAISVEAGCRGFQWRIPRAMLVLAAGPEWHVDNTHARTVRWSIWPPRALRRRQIYYIFEMK